MQYILQTLREYPEIAIFLTLALGFWFGSTKVGSFFGTVASTVPVIGYTIPYAVSRLVMAIAGIAMLLVMK